MDLEAARCGMRVRCDSANDASVIEATLDRYGLRKVVARSRCRVDGKTAVDLVLRPEIANQWIPCHDTTRMAARLQLDTSREAVDLEKEILVTLLASPIIMDFPSVGELLAGIGMRRNIVEAGRKTALNFDTAAAERPADCWRYNDEHGFTVRPGYSLIEALRRATQPEFSGNLYSFSCYRATEYVILLGIAEELAVRNPELLERLQRQCETRVIRSGQFHDVFLREYGS